MMAPNPGSDEAVEKGCTCPRLDNGHGWGYIVAGQFVINHSCPLHGSKIKSRLQ